MRIVESETNIYVMKSCGRKQQYQSTYCPRLTVDGYGWILRVPKVKEDGIVVANTSAATVDLSSPSTPLEGLSESGKVFWKTSCLNKT